MNATSLIRACSPALLLTGALAAFSLWAAPRGPQSIELGRLQPWKIEPRYDDPRVISDAQLCEVLDRMRPPRFREGTNKLIHALRLWGPQAEFDDPQAPDGRRLLGYFLHHPTYAEATGGAPPLFSYGPDGRLLARRFSPDKAATFNRTASHHADDLLATLAECGVPLDQELVTAAGQTTVAQLLRDSLARVHLGQHEIDWSAIAYARYAFPLPAWQNRFGERIHVEELVDRLIDPPPLAGPCGGTHRLEALVVLLRANEQVQALRPPVRQKILDHLRSTARLLAQSQTADGYWTRAWPQGDAAEGAPSAMYDRILVTGHHLEWLALAPPEVLPPRETILRAARWLTAAMLQTDREQLLRHYGPYSHAARALCLWRSTTAWEAWQRKGRVD